MRQTLNIIGDLLWAMFLDDNEWWIKNLERDDVYYAQPGVFRR